MLNRIAWWLVSLIVGGFLRQAARFFEGSCPLENQATWFCRHWDTILPVAVFIFGMLGVEVKNAALKKRQQQRPSLSVVPNCPDPKDDSTREDSIESKWGDNVAPQDEPYDPTNSGG